MAQALYDPGLLAAIRAARADLYAAQAARRVEYLRTNRWPAPMHRATTDVQKARQDLDAARALARDVATPKEADDADV